MDFSNFAIRFRESAAVVKAYETVGSESKKVSPATDFRGKTASLALLDVFQPQPENGPWHGDKVRAVVVGSGIDGKDVVNIDNSTSESSNAALSSLLFEGEKSSLSDRLDAYIELSATNMLAKTNGTLAALAENSEMSLKTINQSQGTSRVDVYELVAGAAFVRGDANESLTEVGQQLAELLAVPAGNNEVQAKILKQSLIDRVESVIDQSSLLKELQDEHVGLIENLRSRGVAIITSAGNNADELQALKDQGFRVPESFDDDLTSVGKKLIVGALDTKGTPETEDDQVAYFSSQYPQVKILANGVGVDSFYGSLTGTSFAAPQVAADYEKLRRQESNWSLDQLEEGVVGHFRLADDFRRS